MQQRRDTAETDAISTQLTLLSTPCTTLFDLMKAFKNTKIGDPEVSVTQHGFINLPPELLYYIALLTDDVSTLGALATINRRMRENMYSINLGTLGHTFFKPWYQRRAIVARNLKTSEMSSRVSETYAKKSDQLVIDNILGLVTSYLSSKNRDLFKLLLFDQLDEIKKMTLTSYDIWYIHSEKNYTAIQLASKLGRWEILRYFYDVLSAPSFEKIKYIKIPLYFYRLFGIDPLEPYSVDRSGHCILHLAAACNLKDEVTTLIDTHPSWINQHSKYGSTTLVTAAEHGHVEIAKFLIDRGADVNKQGGDHGGITPLLIAAKFGHINMVKLLIDNGADINQANTMNETPLHMAALNGHTDVLIALLMKCAEVNLADINRCTPIMNAIYNGYINEVKLLIENDANVNCVARMITSMSPLYMATASGHTDIVKLLLLNNADTTFVTNADGTLAAARANKTALDIARENHYDDLVILLELADRIKRDDKNSWQYKTFELLCGLWGYEFKNAAINLNAAITATISTSSVTHIPDEPSKRMKIG